MAKWSSAVLIPNQHSNTSPALAVIGGTLHLAYEGGDEHKIRLARFVDRQWTPPLNLGFVTYFSPALADPGVLLFKAWRTRDIMASFLRATGWSQPESRYGSTDDAPALARNDQGWHLVHRYLDSTTMNHIVIDGPPDFPPCVGGSLPGESSRAVGIGELNGRIYVVHSGKSSNNLYWTVCARGGGFYGDEQIPNQGSRDRAALASWGGVLHMVHPGDSSNDLWHSTYDPARAAGTQWSTNVKIGLQSGHAPALAAMPDGLHMVFKQGATLYHAAYNADGSPPGPGGTPPDPPGPPDPPDPPDPNDPHDPRKPRRPRDP